MALHKSVEEIRRLTYKEFKQWQIHYLLEPFGSAAHHAILYNINRPENADAKNEDQLLEERAREIITQLQGFPDMGDIPIEEQREIIRQAIMRDFGL